MPNKKSRYNDKSTEYKSPFKNMSDADFVKMSKTKEGKKKVKNNSCVAGLMGRGYTAGRARQLCEQGLAKTMVSDAGKAVKKVASKLKKK
jgi:hypothetical protein